MTTKQNKFFAIIRKTFSEEYPLGDMVSAYVQAYDVKPTDNSDTIYRKAYQVRKRMMESDEVREVLEKYDLGVERVAIELSKELQAMKTLTYQGKIARDKDGKQIDLINHAIRMRALELLAGIQGLDQKNKAGNIMIQNNRLIVYVHDEEAPPLTETQTKFKEEAEKRIHNARNFITEEGNSGDVK